MVILGNEKKRKEIRKQDFKHKQKTFLLSKKRGKKEKTKEIVSESQDQFMSL